jgi:hypothetical protein
MVSLAELSDPSDPKVGAVFCKKLGLPPGMLDAAKPIVNAETLLDLGAQPAGARPDVGNALFDGMFGSSAMEHWTAAQTELLEKLHGGTLRKRTPKSFRRRRRFTFAIGSSRSRVF